MVLLLQAELGDGQMNYARRIWGQAVPLHQDVDRGQAERHPRSEVIGLTVGATFLR